MKATINQADPWKRPNRDDQWARVDYRSRAVAGRPKNMVVVPVVSSFVWIAAACCCALRRRRQQRRLSGKGV